MAITYYPKELLNQIAPKKKIQRLVTQKLTLNRVALSTLNEVSFLKKRTMQTIALKVIRGYRTRFGEERKTGISKSVALGVALNDKVNLVKRVQDATVHEIAQEIKGQYLGDKYRWLPSDASEADPLHQLNYGKVFRFGVGEMPGDRYGCRCGMEILTEDEELDL